MSSHLAPLTSNYARDKSGATAVEFAIIGNAFLMFIMVIFYASMMLYAYAGVYWAVEDASRLAAINTSTTQSDITTAVNSALSSVGLPPATSVSYSVSTAASSFPVATISAQLTQTYDVPLVSNVTITYSAATSVPQGF